jgi:ABC-2 type transport system permease protein
MTGAIRSEVRKLLTTRTVFSLLVAATGLTALLVFGAASAADPGEVTRIVADQPFRDMALLIVPLFVLVLGIRSFTDEFRYGSIVPTLLASPRRLRVLVAKMVVTSLAAIVFGIVLQAVAIGVGAAVVAGRAGGVSAPVGDLVSSIGLGAFAMVLWAWIGIGVGLALRHQVAAIVGPLVFLLAAENVIAGFMPHLGRYLPMHASSAITFSGSTVALLAPGAGALVLAAWTAGALLIGARAMARRDIA